MKIKSKTNEIKSNINVEPRKSSFEIFPLKENKKFNKPFLEEVVFATTGFDWIVFVFIVFATFVVGFFATGLVVFGVAFLIFF